MKYILTFIFLFLFYGGYSFSFFKENSRLFKKDNEQKGNIVDNYKSNFGDFKCSLIETDIYYCENKVDYCYKYDGNRKGGLSCFHKKE